jgi:aspartyl protease family protein
MRKLFFLLIICQTLFAQKQKKIYVDEKYETTNDLSLARFYRVLTYNKDNKSGIEKVYSIDGTLILTGKFLSADVSNFFGNIYEGEWIMYYRNGLKSMVKNFKKGIEYGSRIEYDEEGRINQSIPIINGEPDTENTLMYAYDASGYSTFKGEVLNEGSGFNGEYTLYEKNSDTIIKFLKNCNLDSPSWSIIKPSQKDKINYAIYNDDFEELKLNNNWKCNSDDKAKINIDNGRLSIYFKKYGFVRKVNLVSAPFSLNDNNFNINVDVCLNSSAFSQGIQLGKDVDNFYRINVLNLTNNNRIVTFEKQIDGIFVEEKTINKIYFSDEHDNNLSVKKRDNLIIFSLNGYVLYETENSILLNDEISLTSSGVENFDKAYFDNFKVKIEPTMNKNNEVSVKKTGGVYSLPVELNGILKINFIFDSGASDVSISPDVALILIKGETIKDSDWLQGAYYKFADGSIAKSKRFKLKSLKIGNKVIRNVSCSISNSIDSPMLLGQSVLNRFGKYTFDNKKQLLIFD